MTNETVHPCQKCGACCAYFRVTFHWSETLPESFAVPIESTFVVSPHLVAMRGTESAPVRCRELRGNLGDAVACGIYSRRSSTCRSFGASFEDGTPNSRCDDARARIGLAPLTPDDFHRSPEY